jgi:hypothetical protein
MTATPLEKPREPPNVLSATSKTIYHFVCDRANMLRLKILFVREFFSSPLLVQMMISGKRCGNKKDSKQVPATVSIFTSGIGRG